MNSRPTILFLDFDGVLHRGVARVAGDKVVSERPGEIELFEYAPVLAGILHRFPAVEIVLSTSWVRVLGFEASRSALPPSLSDRVIGATYDESSADAWSWESIARGCQVTSYVRRHVIRRWVAIDDEADGFDGCAEHFVACETALALGSESAQRRLETVLRTLGA